MLPLDESPPSPHVCGGRDRRLNVGLTHAVGHGFGVGMHEFPMLTAQETAELKSGMVLNVEPAVKDSHGFLYHIEDLFVVTDAEPTVLTTVMNADNIFVIQ